MWWRRSEPHSNVPGPLWAERIHECALTLQQRASCLAVCCMHALHRTNQSGDNADVQKRNVHTAADTVACAGLCAPPTAEELGTRCNELPCATYSFRQDNLTSCSAACGTGFQAFNVYCVKKLGSSESVVQDALCPGSPPPRSKLCNTQACAFASYRIGPWQACSATCGGGTALRNVTCYNSNGTAASDDSVCAGLERPDNSRPCNTAPCETIYLEVANWSQCDATCGGRRRRSATCKCAACNSLACCMMLTQV